MKSLILAAAVLVVLVAAALGPLALGQGGEPAKAATAPASAPTAGVAKETWDWPAAMKSAAKKFTGTPGVVLFLGDSITYANQATAWGRNVARGATGHTDSDKEILKWSHAYEGEKDTNGWFLAAVDRPDGRSETASGITTAQYLKGGFHGLPSLAEILKKYNPQVVVILLGANDVNGGRKPDEVAADMKAILQACLDNGAIPVLQTATPIRGRDDKVQAVNQKYLALAAELKVPIIDLHGEFLTRQPGTAWEGTLVGGDGIHLTFVAANGPPTEENLKNSGYLLRCWLAVQKLKEVKAKVIDAK